MSQEELTESFRAGYVAIVGEPNVGKSTLLNALLGQKISIVAKRPQTTRQRVLGILTTDQSQIVFLDTPGLLDPKYLLQETMMRSAQRALEDADAILAMTDVTRGHDLPDMVRMRLEPFAGIKPLLLCINKADVVRRDLLLPMIARFAESKLFREIVPVSALRNENLDSLLNTVTQYVPYHPPLYPKEILSEQPERFFVAEIVREKIFEQFNQEIPYSTAVEIREFREQSEGKSYISADVIVERDSQKGILIGRQGAALKAVGLAARRDIETLIGRPVFLELFVKVGDQWRRKEAWMRRLGYGAE